MLRLDGAVIELEQHLSLLDLVAVMKQHVGDLLSNLEAAI